MSSLPGEDPDYILIGHVITRCLIRRLRRSHTLLLLHRHTHTYENVVISCHLTFTFPWPIIPLTGTIERKCIDNSSIAFTHLTVKTYSVEVASYVKIFQTGISFLI